MPIRSFKNTESKMIACGQRTQRTQRILPAELHPIAYRKLVYLDNIKTLESLRAWPALRLEKLVGNRGEQWSIRINDRSRICFRFESGNVLDVEIVDYH